MKAMYAVMLWVAVATGLGAPTSSDQEELERVLRDPLLESRIAVLLEDKPEDQSETQWLSAAAWGAFAQADYSNAVAIAAGTIGKFEADALKIQAQQTNRAEAMGEDGPHGIGGPCGCSNRAAGL